MIKFALQLLSRSYFKVSFTLCDLCQHQDLISLQNLPKSAHAAVSIQRTHIILDSTADVLSILNLGVFKNFLVSLWERIKDTEKI